MKKYYVDLPLNFKSKPHEALISVWWTSAMLNKKSRELFRSFNISESQFNLMMILKYDTSHLTQNDIGKKMLVDKSNITGLVDSLEQLNFIKRNFVPGDRRRYHITLTQKGKIFIDKVDKVYGQLIKDIMHSFSEKDSIELIKLTKLIRRGLVEVE